MLIMTPYIFSETKKTSEETDEEKKILDELLEVVEQRDALVAMLEEDRLRSVLILIN